MRWVDLWFTRRCQMQRWHFRWHHRPLPSPFWTSLLHLRRRVQPDVLRVIGLATFCCTAWWWWCLRLRAQLFPSSSELSESFDGSFLASYCLGLWWPCSFFPVGETHSEQTAVDDSGLFYYLIRPIQGPCLKDKYRFLWGFFDHILFLPCCTPLLVKLQ